MSANANQNTAETHMQLTALRIYQADNAAAGHAVRAVLESMPVAALTAGDVLIRVQYSSINYKDALAATGAGKILRRYPLNGGVDLAGVVVESTDPTYSPGQSVLVTGCGLSETLDGGYAEYARVPAAAVIAMPSGLDALAAMTLGTAGFTAALAIHRMEQNGLEPQQGEVAVTGATGGVGSVAIDMLTTRGYQVCAITGKEAERNYLRQLGTLCCVANCSWARLRSSPRASPVPSITSAASGFHGYYAVPN
jgi:acrylyl-CoA reductase (NADPH)